MITKCLVFFALCVGVVMLNAYYPSMTTAEALAQAGKNETNFRLITELKNYVWMIPVASLFMFVPNVRDWLQKLTESRTNAKD